MKRLGILGKHEKHRTDPDRGRTLFGNGSGNFFVILLHYF